MINQQKQKQIFIFIGPPGSGKGSLSHLCVEQLGWAQLSTGDLCRQHIAEKTEVGKQIDFFIKSGKLIPDNFVIDMVEDWILDKFKNLDVLILDGFPRTVAQAGALDELLKKNIFSGVQLHVVQLMIDDFAVASRLESRLICSNKECGAVYSRLVEKLFPQNSMKCDKCDSSLIVRSDDNPESVKHRLVTYHKHSNDLLGYYKTKGQKLYQLDVDKPLEKVFEEFMRYVSVELEQ